MKNLFPIICVVLILIGGAGSLIYFTQPEEPVIEQCDVQCYEREFQEVNNKLDWVEKALVSLQEEKEALLQEREAIQLAVIKIFKLQTDSEEHWSTEKTEREPGQITEDGSHQVMPATTGDDSHERFKQLMSSYGLDPSTIREVENHYWIKEWVIGCITVAETSWWNRWAGKKNIGSVWSNDRWDRPTYALMEAWLEAIGKTLNNWYLWSIQTLGCLSNAGSCQSRDNNWKRYATSTEFWEKNMVVCLETIYWKGTVDPKTFIIRR